MFCMMNVFHPKSNDKACANAEQNSSDRGMLTICLSGFRIGDSFRIRWKDVLNSRNRDSGRGRPQMFIAIRYDDLEFVIQKIKSCIFVRHARNLVAFGE